jgi:hypothetical protein
LFTSTYAIDTILVCVLVSTIITNEFIGEEFHPSPKSLNGNEAMGFDVTQLTQDEEPSLFKLNTNKPIPMLVYGGTLSSGKNMVITFYRQV